MTDSSSSDVFRAVQEITIEVREQGDFACSFCARLRTQVQRLIAGPAVFICNNCIKKARDGETAEADADAGTDCRFCGQPAGEVKYMFTRHNAAICDGCLKMVEEFVAEGKPTPPP